MFTFQSRLYPIVYKDAKTVHALVLLFIALETLQDAGNELERQSLDTRSVSIRVSPPTVSLVLCSNYNSFHMANVPATTNVRSHGIVEDSDLSSMWQC